MKSVKGTVLMPKILGGYECVIAVVKFMSMYEALQIVIDVLITSKEVVVWNSSTLKASLSK